MRMDSATLDDTSIGARMAVWIATGLGVGFASPAPGTIGGLWGLALLPPMSKLSPVGVQAVCIIVLLLVAVGICGVAARAISAGPDPQPIVLDEIVVLPIVFLGAPNLQWPVVLAGYLLFRLFDVLKLGMARSAEKLPGGWGIVADDAVAAVMAWCAMQGLYWLDRTVDLGWLAAAGA